MGYATKLAGIIALMALAAACGSTVDKGPKKASNNNEANNETPNNETPNNETPNNETPNNETPNNETPNNTLPCVGVSPASLNFGDVGLGSQAEAVVTIENCSTTESLTLDDATSVTGFEVALPEVAQIPPQTSFPVTVLFAPIEPGGHVGMLTISTSAGAVSVNVQGNGLEAVEGCPTPVAQGRANPADAWTALVNANVQTTVQLTGSNSTATSSIDRYEWSIATRPQGSTARLNPAATVENPEFFLDLPGLYELDLRVWTPRSPDDCPAARLTIVAASDDPNEIVVQLTWDTPGDADQTDESGSDMDLHYMHPSGMWNMSPYDCYWLNKDADWGADGMASVDIDDTNGAGPENISHRNAGPKMYQIGVYYYADNLLGPSTATLRLSRGGSLIAERNRMLNAAAEFWHVGSLNAATDVFTPNDTVTNGFPP